MFIFIKDAKQKLKCLLFFGGSICVEKDKDI
jgi:hypothetical protein